MRSFLSVLDPADTSSGGGSACALTGAMAAALVAMVARLPVRSGSPAGTEAFGQLAVEAEALSAELLQGAAEDTQAYRGLRAAYRLPRQTDEQLGERHRAIQQAAQLATHVPLSNAQRCWQVLQIEARLRGRSNPSAAADLRCAAYLAEAGLLGCVATAEANLPLIKDEAQAAQLAGQARELRAAALNRSDSAAEE